MKDESSLADFLKLSLVLVILATVNAMCSPSIPGLVTVQGGGLFDHCKIQFATWQGNPLNEVPPPSVPYVYVDHCCRSYCF